MRFPRRTSTRTIEMIPSAEPHTAITEAIQRTFTLHKTLFEQSIQAIIYARYGLGLAQKRSPVDRKHYIKKLYEEELLLCNTINEENDNTTETEDNGTATQPRKLYLLPRRLIMLAIWSLFDLEATLHVKLESVLAEAIKPATIDDKIKKDMLIAFIEIFIIRRMKDHITHNRQNAEQQLTELFELICKTIKEKEFKRTVLDAYLDAKIIYHMHKMKACCKQANRNPREFCRAAWAFTQALKERQKTKYNKPYDRDKNFLIAEACYRIMGCEQLDVKKDYIIQCNRIMIALSITSSRYSEKNSSLGSRAYSRPTAETLLGIEIFLNICVSREYHKNFLTAKPTKKNHTDVSQYLRHYYNLRNPRNDMPQAVNRPSCWSSCRRLEKLDELRGDCESLIHLANCHPHVKYKKATELITEINQWITASAPNNKKVIVATDIKTSLMMLNFQILNFLAEVIQRNYLKRYQKRNNAARVIQRYYKRASSL